MTATLEKTVRTPKALTPRFGPDEDALIVPLDRISTGRNVRANWDEDNEDLRRLQDSIATVGLLEPLVVRRIGANQGQPRYELVLGYRRYKALQSLGKLSAPVRLIHARDDEILARQMTENLARREMDEADVIRGLEQLVEVYGWGNTVITGTNMKCWWTMLIPRSMASDGPVRWTSLPSSRIWPSSGRASP